jgi:hypothetical protein
VTIHEFTILDLPFRTKNNIYIQGKIIDTRNELKYVRENSGAKSVHEYIPMRGPKY